MSEPEIILKARTIKAKTERFLSLWELYQQDTVTIGEEERQIPQAWKDDIRDKGLALQSEIKQLAGEW